MIHDNNIKFKQPHLKWIYYDIETYNTEQSRDIPSWKISTCHISTIQIRLIDGDNITDTILVNNQCDYRYKQESLSGIKILLFETEEQTCRFFFKLLSAAKDCVCVAYNGSGTLRPRANESGRIVDKDNSGYDLPWIINRSRQSWSPIYQKFNSKTWTQKDDNNNAILANCISKILELPRVHFIEAMRSVTDAINMNKMTVQSLSLSSVCEAFNIQQQKLDISHHEQWDLLQQHGADITDLLVYGIRDVVCLHELMLKIGSVYDSVALCETWNMPLSWCFHKTQAQGLEHYFIGLYRKQGYLTCYLPRDEQCQFKGAYTAVKPGFYENVLQADF